MNMKLRAFILAFALLFTFKTAVFAENEAGASALLKTRTQESRLVNKDLRSVKLENFFKNYYSPFGEGEIDAFINEAERNQLDWRLLPAIAGKESTFGRFIPTNSYNPFGWGVFGDQVTYFNSFEEAIMLVAQGLKQKYNTQTVFNIAATYCPINPYGWTGGVLNLMAQIENTPVDSQDLLVINL